MGVGTLGMKSCSGRGCGYFLLQYTQENTLCQPLLVTLSLLPLAQLAKAPLLMGADHWQEWVRWPRFPLLRPFKRRHRLTEATKGLCPRQRLPFQVPSAFPSPHQE